MSKGFSPLANTLDPSKDGAKEKERLNEIKQQLRTTKDGQEYLEQLETAPRVYGRIAHNAGWS